MHDYFTSMESGDFVLLIKYSPINLIYRILTFPLPLIRLGLCDIISYFALAIMISKICMQLVRRDYGLTDELTDCLYLYDCISPHS